MTNETIERDRSPEGRFKYLAEKRTTKALRSIESIGKLSERKNYSYTPDQVDKIMNALEEAVNELKILLRVIMWRVLKNSLLKLSFLIKYSMKKILILFRYYVGVIKKIFFISKKFNIEIS